MLCPSNLDSFTFEDAPLFQDVFEPALPSLPPHPPIGEFISTFPFMDVLPVQAAKQNALPSLPHAPGAPSIHPQATAMPPAKGVRNFYVSGGESSSTPIVVPATTPVGLTICTSPKKYPHLKVTQPVTSLPLTTTFPIDWIRIPQRVYDHGRKQRNFKPSEPILFSTNGHPGINLGDALRKRFTGLDGRDDPMLPVPARAISCRLLVGFSCCLSTIVAELNPLQVPRLPRLRSIVPGKTSPSIMLSHVNHKAKGPRIELD